jgi:hypothetical protein
MGNTLAILRTLTTYGTWLRGDKRCWTDGYDKRFCFDEASVRQRIEYVQRHNLAIALPANPWPFLEIPER